MFFERLDQFVLLVFTTGTTSSTTGTISTTGTTSTTSIGTVWAEQPQLCSTRISSRTACKHQLKTIITNVDFFGHLDIWCLRGDMWFVNAVWVLENIFCA